MSAKRLALCQMAPIIGAAFKMMVPLIVIVPGLLGLAVLPVRLVGRDPGGCNGSHSYNEVLPLMMARYLGPGLLGLGDYGFDCWIHVGHGGQRQCLRHRLDL